MRKGGRLRTAVLSADLPEDALTGGSRVTLIHKSSALVEGQQGVVELSDKRIRLRTKEGTVSVCGEALCLRCLSRDAALITGDPVTAVTYDRPGSM